MEFLALSLEIQNFSGKSKSSAGDPNHYLEIQKNAGK
jgi:hypothetical protein